MPLFDSISGCSVQGVLEIRFFEHFEAWRLALVIHLEVSKASKNLQDLTIGQDGPRYMAYSA